MINAILFAEWIAMQGYTVDKVVDDQTYWVKGNFPCGTTSDLYTKFKTMQSFKS